MGVRLVPDATWGFVRALWGIEGLTRQSESPKRMVQHLNRHPITSVYSDCHVRSHGVHHFFPPENIPDPPLEFDCLYHSLSLLSSYLNAAHIVMNIFFLHFLDHVIY